MEIAFVGLVVLALIVFFFLKKGSKQSPSQPEQDVAPSTTPSQEVKREATPSLESASSEADSPRAPADAESAEHEATETQDEAAPLAPSGDTVPAASAEGETLASDAPEAEEELDTDADLEEAGSPPPPPVRSGSATESLGRRPELQSLRKGLARSRQTEGFFGKLKNLLGGSKEIDPAIADEIEEILLTSDVGVSTTEAILERVKERLDRGDLKSQSQVFEALKEEARRTLSVDGRSGGIVLRGQPTVVLMVGVNGAGKTTTIGKLAAQFSQAGKKVMLAAGDTFRAAAVDQLKAWGERVGCEVISGKENADPSSVLFDAIGCARDAGADVLLADTAGRLHTKTNLMQEMSKIQKTAQKALDGAPHEVLLVIDSTNGQNALAQAKEFKEALNLSGLILTKLDGTARGGAVLGICDTLQLPVRYIGVGERTEDLYEFDTDAFVEALLGSEKDEIAA